jgi:hypothetical protein
MLFSFPLFQAEFAELDQVLNGLKVDTEKAFKFQIQRQKEVSLTWSTYYGTQV